MKQIRIWDVPTRLVHWSLVALVALSWWSAENGVMDWHRYSGYAILGLVVFRLYWGIFGSTTARFAQFVKGPRAVIDYLRGSTKAVGHNPLGALSVVVILILLMTQVGLGLFAVDIDGLESGPLSRFVSFDAGRELAESHELVFNILMVFIVLHVAAILFYLLVKRDNLIGAMFNGRKDVPADIAAPTVEAAPLRVFVGIVIAAAVVWLIA